MKKYIFSISVGLLCIVLGKLSFGPSIIWIIVTVLTVLREVYLQKQKKAERICVNLFKRIFILLAVSFGLLAMLCVSADASDYSVFWAEINRIHLNFGNWVYVEALFFSIAVGVIHPILDKFD